MSAPRWAVEALDAALDALFPGGGKQDKNAAALELSRRCVSREEFEEVLRDLCHRPCETKGPEDYEPGCCGPCRARAALKEATHADR